MMPIIEKRFADDRMLDLIDALHLLELGIL
jgi:hypothetical protein